MSYDHGPHDAHGPGHDRHGGHAHDHAPASFGMAFALGIALNAGFVVLEVVYGLIGNSVALLADAGHNMSDVLGLGVAWSAAILARRAPTQRFTYGLGGTSILAALFNAAFLLVIIGGLSWEAIGRLRDPQPVAGVTMMSPSPGILINGLCAWLFASGRKGDLNIRGAFAHMAADALVSVGVVIAGLMILFTGWLWLDPATSLIVNAIIVFGTWGLLRDSVVMSLNAVPSGDRIATGRHVSFGDGRRAGNSRPAHLVDEHHGNRADRPSGDAGRPSGRRVPGRFVREAEGTLRDRPRDVPSGNRSAHRLPARTRSCRLERVRKT